MTDQDRQRLEELLANLDAAKQRIVAAARPFTEAALAIDAVRQALLDRHGTEVCGRCDTCGTVLFVDDMGHEDADGVMLCADHAPTWNDIRRLYDQAQDEAETIGPDESAYVDERIAAGDGDKPHVWKLQA